MAQQYYDRDGYPIHARPNGMLKVLTSLCVIALAFVAVVTQWQTIAAYLPTPGPIIVIATPTTGTAPRATLPAYQPRPAAPAQPAAATAQPAIDAYNATAEAQYQEAISAPAPVENIGQGERVVLEQRAAPERLPAGDNVPTAMPLPQPDNSGAFGSKSKPVNIQETKTCLHGQVWVNPGCRNPTPVK